jgi:hypothetical protein
LPELLHGKEMSVKFAMHATTPEPFDGTQLLSMTENGIARS